MLHRSLEALDLENQMEPAEAATALDAISKDSASAFMANEDPAAQHPEREFGFDRS